MYIYRHIIYIIRAFLKTNMMHKHLFSSKIFINFMNSFCLIFGPKSCPITPQLIYYSGGSFK